MSLNEQETRRRPPFGEMLRRSFRHLFQGVVRMPLAFAVAVVGLTAIKVGFSQVGPAQLAVAFAAMGPSERSFTLIALSFAEAFARLLFLVPLSLAMYRFVLRDETYAWRAVVPHIAAFFAWSALLDVLTTAMDALRLLMPMRFLAVATVLGVVGILLIAMLGIRLWMIFPAIALGKPATFLERAAISWRQTQGHFWYLFWLDIVIALALTIPFSVVTYMLGRATVSGGIAQALTVVSLTYSAIVAAIRSIGTVLRAGADASIGGEFYRAVILGGGSDAEKTAEHFT